MSKIYTRNFRVRWSEIDPNGQVSPSYYLRYLVETASDWGATQLGEDDIERMGKSGSFAKQNLPSSVPFNPNPGTLPTPTPQRAN